MSETSLDLKKAACIINPGSARRKWLRRKRLQRLLARMLPGQKFDILADKESTVALVREVSPNHDVIIAIGGDGTIADVLQGIREAQREKEVALGIVPLGSGNAFRKSLAIPKDVRRAIRVLRRGETKEVRLMDIEGQTAGFSSIGGTALVTQNKLQHDIQGFWGHVVAGRKIFSLPAWEIVAELEDGLDDRGRAFASQKLRLKIFDCVVTRSKYFGYSWRIAPKASLDDDYLDITFYEISGWKYALVLPLLYFGLYQRTQKHFKARRLILKGKNLPIQYHGESLGTRDRVEVAVLPHSVRFICPPISKRPRRKAIGRKKP
jgi:diacylglycerol kinase family enzyme